MKALRIVPFLLVGACAALPVPPEATPYYAEQLAAARTAPRAVAADPEAAVLREGAAALDVRAAAEAERIRRGDETDGLVEVDSPEAREFLAQLADLTKADNVIASTPLDIDRALLAAYARNPDVAAARASWAATVRMYEQATYLEDLLLRYSAFTRLATPRVGAQAMREAAFPYPGLVALKGEMIDREVSMAREMARMKLRDALVETAKAWHTTVHHGEELKIRDEQLSLAKRMVDATRARVTSGRSPQAELLEMEAEVAMAENDRQHAITSLARARAELNTLLGRDPHAPLVVPAHDFEVPGGSPAPVEPLIALARRYSPEVRVARAEAMRTAAAIRMSEAMLFAAPAPGAVAPGAPMGGVMPTPDASAETSSGGMGGAMGSAASGTTPALPSLAPRDEPPSGAPGAFGPDVAWVAELRERHVALERAADEALRAAERRVLGAHYEMEAMRRMYVVAAKSTEPLSAQAVEERMRLYEAGRAEFAELVGAFKRHLAAAHDAVAAQHDYFMEQAMLWMAIGARPDLVRAGEGEPQ